MKIEELKRLFKADREGKSRLSDLLQYLKETHLDLYNVKLEYIDNKKQYAKLTIFLDAVGLFDFEYTEIKEWLCLPMSLFDALYIGLWKKGNQLYPQYRIKIEVS